jgi:hypothetical protein
MVTSGALCDVIARMFADGVLRQPFRFQPRPISSRALHCHTALHAFPCSHPLVLSRAGSFPLLRAPTSLCARRDSMRGKLCCNEGLRRKLYLVGGVRRGAGQHTCWCRCAMSCSSLHNCTPPDHLNHYVTSAHTSPFDCVEQASPVIRFSQDVLADRLEYLT